MSRGTPILFSADMSTEATDKLIRLGGSPASPVRVSSPFDKRLRRELPHVRHPRSFAPIPPQIITLCPHRDLRSLPLTRACSTPPHSLSGSLVCRANIGNVVMLPAASERSTANIAGRLRALTGGEAEHAEAVRASSVR